MTTNYRATSAPTLTLASLAASSSLTVGRASAAFDNGTNKDDSLGVSGFITAGTSPTVGLIEVWAFAQRADSTWPELFTAAYSGSDGGFTVNSRDILLAGAVLVGCVINDTTSNRAYVIKLRDVAMLFGFAPKQFALFVTHSTGVALNATGGNHALTVHPVSYA